MSHISATKSLQNYIRYSFVSKLELSKPTVVELWCLDRSQVWTVAGCILLPRKPRLLGIEYLGINMREPFINLLK